MTPTRITSLLAAVLATALLLAGCGGGSSGNGIADMSADEIVAEAVDAAKSAESVHVHGSTASSGGLELDLQLVADTGGAGTITVEGVTFEIVRIGDKAYFKGDDAFWEQFGGAALVELVGDRWVEASATAGDLASFTPLTDLEQMFSEILTEHGALEKGDETDVDGQPAIVVTDTEDGGDLYVSTEGEPYPLKIEQSGDEGGEIFFDSWDEAFELTVPEDTIDASQLQGG